MLFLICRKENANERKESLLSICRVQLFFCKDTTFPRNFQGFWEKCRDDDNENEGFNIKLPSEIASQK
jgi:hypothetical protein